MKFYKHPTTIEGYNAHRTLYKALDKKEKRQYKKAKFFGFIGKIVSLLTVCLCMVVAIQVSNLIRPFADGVFFYILNGIIKFLFRVCCFIVSLILSVLVALPLWNMGAKHQKEQKDILRFKATEHLRTAYKLTEPCLVTKCYECLDDAKFNLHDVCIFFVGDELRITTNLLHGFFNPVNDLGCYMFSKDEVTVTMIPYKETVAAKLACSEITFILGQRAYKFIKKNFTKLQGASTMTIPGTHLMKLQPAPFAAIQSGHKTLELRLNDGKRQKIKVGDTIVFTQTETGETLRAAVSDIRKYPDFEAMYGVEDPIAMGYSEGETADPKDMSQYYTEDEIKRYGTLAIEIKKIEA